MVDSAALRNEHVVHPDLRLGRRKPHVDKPRLKIGQFLTGVVPPKPVAADHFAKVPSWGMYKNNVWGICGPTGVANSRRLITSYTNGTMVAPPQTDVTDLYVRSTNPSFNPVTGENDDGVIVQDMLAEVVKNGIGGVKALGFAEVDHTNIDEIMAAIAIFGFVLFGSDLRQAQQAQTDSGLWDYVASPDWGGHCTLGGRYADEVDNTKDRTGNITWAKAVDLTDRFIDQQLEECWVVIWPEHLRDNAFLNGVNVQAFADAYHQITKRQFPVPVPTPVSPANPGHDPVTPTPTHDVTFHITDQKVVDRVLTASARAHLSLDEWATKHFHTYFKIG